MDIPPFAKNVDTAAGTGVPLWMGGREKERERGREGGGYGDTYDWTHTDTPVHTQNTPKMGILGCSATAWPCFSCTWLAAFYVARSLSCG